MDEKLVIRLVRKLIKSNGNGHHELDDLIAADELTEVEASVIKLRTSLALLGSRLNSVIEKAASL